VVAENVPYYLNKQELLELERWIGGKGVAAGGFGLKNPKNICHLA